MKPFLISILNSIVLIILGSWAYFSAGTPSITALIPVFTGIIMLLLTPGFKRGNPVLSHIVVVLTFLILLGLIKPLTGAIGREDKLGIARVLVMMITSIIAMIVFVKSFIDARRTPKK